MTCTEPACGTPFSILERIVYAVTPATTDGGELPGTTFSILERIVYAVTPGIALPLIPVAVFQYPRTDRLRCNRTVEFARCL